MADVTIDIEIECSECGRSIETKSKYGIIIINTCECQTKKIEDLEEKISEKEYIIQKMEQDTMKS